jgi:hypothetical protein
VSTVSAPRGWAGMHGNAERIISPRCPRTRSAHCRGCGPLVPSQVVVSQQQGRRHRPHAIRGVTWHRPPGIAERKARDWEPPFSSDSGD